MKNHDDKRGTKSYLLTCGCSAALTVGPGQAGGVVTCPRCGASLPVPRLGELARLPAAAPAAGVPAASWTAAHGCVLGGILVALLAVCAAAYLSMAPRPVVDDAMIRAGVAAASTSDIYKAWQALARSGVSRPIMADEERIQQVARSARAVATVLWTVAAVGAAVAIGGGIAMAGERKPAS
ncbi:MAG: hypothetical protein LW698_03660 [Planctomycetaceae bacterium]|jgi:hypothetical protein|nr:hypothetical protein [Planctomycetaceae bacterium]